MEKSTLGDFNILKRISKGSCGSVYVGEHRFLKRNFALKVLPEELLEDDGFLKRFEERVKQIVLLQHENIVKVHNVSESDGKYFLVSDYIGGDELVNLSKYIERSHGFIPEQQVLDILKQVATALDYAHQTVPGGRFGHEGLKLNNILVGEEVGSPKVYLCDFGVSGIVGMANFLTMAHKILAKNIATEKIDDKESYINHLDKDELAYLHNSFLQGYAFLAPEQKHMFVNNMQVIGSKADIYSFGVLAYYLLMNKFPEGYFEMPSRRMQPLEFTWDNLISECLQPDPNKRPFSLKEIVESVSNKNASGIKVEIKDQVPIQEEVKPEPTPRLVITPQKIAKPEYEMDPGAVFQIDSGARKYKQEHLPEKVISPILTEMRIIKNGSFYRGSDNGARDSQPRHKIFLNSFAIDIHPVTNEQFVLFLEMMGGEKDSNNLDTIRLRDSRIKRSGGKLSIESGYSKHPVVGVSWYGAVAYAKWVGKRLPTEAEWEIAAYGGIQDTIYPTGNSIERQQANFFSADTTSVMSYPPNAYGLYDMAGNVYEWCQDWYDHHYYDVSVQEPNNPKGPLQGVYRVLRGGCWKSSKDDLMCAHRHRNNPGMMTGTYGFRCAADVVSG